MSDDSTSSDHKKLQSMYVSKRDQFRTHLRRMWINVLLHDEITAILEDKCSNPAYGDRIIIDEESPFQPIRRGALEGENKQENIRLKGNNLLEFLKSSKGAGSEWMSNWTLVSAIGLFEAFVSDVASIAYLSDPKRFLLTESKTANDQENYKVLKILLESTNKEEALEKYTEEKLRGIFYGNPISAFYNLTKEGKSSDGKLRFQIDKTMYGKCRDEFLFYQEMIGRRNAIVHNAGKVDAKYVREVPSIPTKLEIETKVKIDKDYIAKSIKVLAKLATEYTIAVSTCTGR